MAAGTISGIRGDLQLRSVRLRIADEGRGILWHLEIERATNKALKEGVLRLKRQRIQSKRQGTAKDPIGAPQNSGFTVGAASKRQHHGNTPSFWRSLRRKFDVLAKRQRSSLGQGTHARWLKVYLDFSKDAGEFGRYRFQGGLDGNLLSEFEDLATQGAYALGCPPNVEPVGFWLHGLGQDLLRATKPEIRSEFSPGGAWGGYIPGLLNSCAAYCSRLAATAEE